MKIYTLNLKSCPVLYQKKFYEGQVVRLFESDEQYLILNLECRKKILCNLFKEKTGEILEISWNKIEYRNNIVDCVYNDELRIGIQKNLVFDISLKDKHFKIIKNIVNDLNSSFSDLIILNDIYYYYLSHKYKIIYKNILLLDEKVNLLSNGVILHNGLNEVYNINGDILYYSKEKLNEKEFTVVTKRLKKEIIQNKKKLMMYYRERIQNLKTEIDMIHKCIKV